MNKSQICQYIVLICIIIATLSIAYLGITRVGYFYKYQPVAFFQKVVLTKAFFIPLGAFVVAGITALIDTYSFKKK